MLDSLLYLKFIIVMCNHNIYIQELVYAKKLHREEMYLVFGMCMHKLQSDLRDLLIYPGHLWQFRKAVWPSNFILICSTNKNKL
jgi:hypothetical protein